jgi:6-phosphofructokinase 1
MRIGILTGGGDVPGLNACIKAVVNRVAEEGHEVVGIRRGWGGLAYYNPDDPQATGSDLITLDPGVVRTIDRTGGTFLHTSRTNPGKVRAAEIPHFLDVQADDEGYADITPHVLRVLEDRGIDVLIPIGGDDTLSYGLRLHEEGVPVIAIPKTSRWWSCSGDTAARRPWSRPTSLVSTGPSSPRSHSTSTSWPECSRPIERPIPLVTR